MSSLLQLKKGCPRASKDGLEAARQETFSQLTQPAVLHPDALITRDQAIREVNRTTRELFRNLRIQPHQLLKLEFPSTSANYTNSRKDGGAVTAVAESIYGCNVDPNFVDFEVVRWYCEDTGSWEVRHAGKLNQSIDRQRNDAAIAMGLVDKALMDFNIVDTVALPEALKVRVITKGSGLRGYVLKPLQKILHSHLRKIPQFSLIGEPVTEKRCEEVLGQLLHGEKWLSGDYKAATDGLLSCLSEAAANAISDICFRQDDWIEFPGLWQKYRQLFIDALTKHWVMDPSKKEFAQGQTEWDFLFPQRNGQLMGSIVSFPILCVVNAALCRKALELGASENFDRMVMYDPTQWFEVNPNVRIRIKDCPMLINGDDCVFPACERTHAYWLALCPSFGMMPSVGKYYWSSEFMNINSTTFLYDLRYEWELEELEVGGMNVNCYAFLGENVPRWFQQIQFINLGILLHQKRSGGLMGPDSVFDEFSSFSANSKDLLETLPESCKTEIYDIFVWLFKRLATHLGIRLPFFVPREYGGVGLRPHGKWQPTKHQRSLAKLFREKGEIFEILKKDSNWQMHKKFLELIDVMNLPLVEESPGYDTFYGNMMVNLFLVHASDNSVELWKDSRKMDGKCLRRAEKRWAWANKLRTIPSSLGFDPWAEDVKPLRPLILESDWTMLPEYFHGLEPWQGIEMVDCFDLSIEPSTRPFSYEIDENKYNLYDLALGGLFL
jgi:hypothetical protein